MTLALTTTFGVAWANEKLLALLRTNYQPRPPWGYHCDATVLGGAVLTYSKKRGNLDGDKLVCDPGATLAQRADSPCRVVSVGSNGDMSFENATRTAAPHCAIDTWDGTLGGHNVAKKRMKLEAAKWLNFIPRNFEPSSWQFYAHASNHSKGWRRHRPSVRLLKMDCEGCEFDSLRPWLTNVCTEQILIEVSPLERGDAVPMPRPLSLGAHG